MLGEKSNKEAEQDGGGNSATLRASPWTFAQEYTNRCMIVRRYQSGDEIAIWDVYFRATHESNSRDYHPDLLNRWAPADQDMSEWSERCIQKNPFVAIIEDRVVGMAELEEDGFVEYFYVSPDFQGQGVGSSMLARIESEAVEMNLSELTADVSLTAKEFFESRGFIITEARSNLILGHLAPNFAMSKHLQSEQGGGGNSAALRASP